MPKSKQTKRKSTKANPSLAIKGKAKKVGDFWQIGKKKIAVGKGIVSISSANSLDRATGYVFSKKANPAKKRTTKKAAKKTVKSMGRPAKKAAKKTARKAAKPTKKKNPSLQKKARKDRKEFAGRVSGSAKLYFPSGTPEGISKLGIFNKMILASGLEIKTTGDDVWLCQDTKHRLHIGSKRPGRMLDLEAGNYGPIERVYYVESKPHLNEKKPVNWNHQLGELTGERPSLAIDKDGQPRIKGGAYSINWRGIVN